MEDNREMFKGVCSECGEECKIPFEPKEGRPIKCNECFRRSRPQGRDFNKRSRKRDFEVICADCGKKTTVPFKPTQGKPVKCRECFKK